MGCAAFNCNSTLCSFSFRLNSKVHNKFLITIFSKKKFSRIKINPEQGMIVNSFFHALSAEEINDAAPCRQYNSLKSD